VLSLSASPVRYVDMYSNGSLQDTPAHAPAPKSRSSPPWRQVHSLVKSTWTSSRVNTYTRSSNNNNNDCKVWMIRVHQYTASQYRILPSRVVHHAVYHYDHSLLHTTSSIVRASTASRLYTEFFHHFVSYPTLSFYSPPTSLFSTNQSIRPAFPCLPTLARRRL
jgi:hypothetical protein